MSRFATVSVFLSIVFGLLTGCRSARPESDPECLRWRALVDPNVEYSRQEDALSKSGPAQDLFAISPDLRDVSVLSDDEVLSAIRCLLSFQGERGEARYWGATDIRSSAITGPCDIEVAALYYVSYLFTGDWIHGTNVALIDRRGHVNDAADIRTAFRAYRRWFATVEKIGLNRARKDGLDPLEGSGVHWY